uniref:Uncharacterized protein n=1 Tax=Oryza punctata TaxID=4537 RepID=A0A0E0MB40_ORYPU
MVTAARGRIWCGASSRRWRHCGACGDVGGSNGAGARGDGDGGNGADFMATVAAAACRRRQHCGWSTALTTVGCCGIGALAAEATARNSWRRLRGDRSRLAAVGSVPASSWSCVLVLSVCGGGLL